MSKIEINPIEYPHLSQWEENHLNETIEKLTRQANPNKKEITQADKQWTATMLEMDLKAQSGAIWEDEQEEPKWEKTLEHNKKYYQQLEAMGIEVSPAEPELPQEVIQEALRQQEIGRKKKLLYQLEAEKNEEKIRKIYHTETDPEVKEIARQIAMELIDLPL